ncbi:hypothetical protein F5B18DRAFT_670783 [Nemania serpens]|nr:hypothetical protein F5B18DRAFT_670783 [Nemania serpens]
MPTILDILTRPNPKPIRDNLKPGGNTEIETNINVPEDWRPWDGFTYEALTNLFRTQLYSPYRGHEQTLRPLKQDLTLFQEDTVEDFLRRFVVPDVNSCLDQEESKPHFGRGSRCGDDADWSLISPMFVDEQGKFLNFLPGDTKVSSKWHSEMGNDTSWGTAKSRSTERQKPVDQIVTYMARNGQRYGFLLTDEEVVVFRISRRYMGEGLATDRPQRQVTFSISSHQRQVSGASDISMASGTTSSQELSYVDDNGENWDYNSPEYLAISLNEDGPSCLTAKLALWFLAMMAVCGESNIDYEYSPLDSWRVNPQGGITHVTHGGTKDAPETNDVLQEPGPSQQAGGSIARVSQSVVQLSVSGGPNRGLGEKGATRGA